MKLQAPKGTRDFYPKECAWRQHLIDAWRRVSIRNGFEQVDGPIFESLDLYKVKSGEGIVNELFHFQDRGERELAIRPEFTPTLARMVAAQANALPKPIKWFCTPNLCRAEKPQKGRGREFWQWNVDLLGTDVQQSPLADAECIFTLVDFMNEMGLRPEHVRVKISHRQTVRHILSKMGVADDKIDDAFVLLDRRDKLVESEFLTAAAALGLDEMRVQRFNETCRRKFPAGDLDHLTRAIGLNESPEDLEALDRELRAFGIAEWCEYDLGIVRGLAYYTGTVFEAHETSGAMRAMAGGGRYDQLIELFGGPKTPAVGFGMGDMVISDVLIDKGLAPENVTPKPDVFVIAANDNAATHIGSIVASLRKAGVHARFSYKTTRSVGKLLKDAATSGARFAVIVDDAIAKNLVQIKDLAGGAQEEITLAELPAKLNRT